MDDAAALVRHADNPNIARNLRDLFPSPYAHADARAFLGRSVEESPVTNFAIEVDGEAAGGIGVHLDADVYRRDAEVGYWLGEAYWGRGIATDAVRAVTAYAFERFDLVRIHAEVFARNVASARVLEKAGFALEGRLRARVTKEGETLDALLYALVRDA